MRTDKQSHIFFAAAATPNSLTEGDLLSLLRRVELRLHTGKTTTSKAFCVMSSRMATLETDSSVMASSSAVTAGGNVQEGRDGQCGEGVREERER